VPLAAALNGAKGEASVLNRRRGWPDDLAPALHVNNVDRAAVDALNEAVTDSLGDFRRYLRAKAARHGHDGGLPWWDLFAPITAGSSDGPAVTWDEAIARVTDAFSTYSPVLAGLVRRAVDERWLDAEPRAGKVGGAYCLPIGGGASRVLLNFDGSFDGVQTLAHELGHAYHNTNLGQATALQRQTPMALAETASIFCETIMVNAGLAAAGPAERLALLDTDLQGATQVVVDIRSRFLFESELCRRRATRTLSVAELNELMLDTQEQAYGDGLHPDHRHPFMWAVKGHYYTPAWSRREPTLDTCSDLRIPSSRRPRSSPAWMAYPAAAWLLKLRSLRRPPRPVRCSASAPTAAPGSAARRCSCGRIGWSGTTARCSAMTPAPARSRFGQSPAWKSTTPATRSCSSAPWSSRVVATRPG
jgi:oligoendopeptidase F